MDGIARRLLAYFLGVSADSSEEVTPAELAPPDEPVVEPIVEGVVEEVQEPVEVRESTATGNREIEILRHELYDAYKNNDGELCPAGVDLAIRNLAESTIAAAIIKVSFYDMEGNVVDTAKHKAIELRPDTSRSIQINSRVKQADLVKSYDVRIVKARTADVEKVQVRSHGISRNSAGEEVVEGIVKNISKGMAEAAVVITFFDVNKEDLGRKIIVLHDIEPETIRQFDFTFKPPEGETVVNYSIALGDMVE